MDRNEEMSYLECTAKIKALESANNLLVQDQAALVEARRQNELLRDRAYRAEDLVERANGALQTAAAHNVELEKERDALQAQLQELLAALEEVVQASRGVPDQLGADRVGDCALNDCHCSNHIAHAAIAKWRNK